MTELEKEYVLIRQKRDEVPEGTLSCLDRNLAVFRHYRHYEGLRLLPSVCEQIIIQQTLINKDKANFEKVSDALSNYLKEEQENRILNEDSYAAQVLRMIVEVGGFEIYTFNYTNLENIANSCDVKIDS